MSDDKQESLFKTGAERVQVKVIIAGALLHAFVSAGTDSSRGATHTDQSLLDRSFELAEKFMQRSEALERESRDGMLAESEPNISSDVATPLGKESTG